MRSNTRVSLAFLLEGRVEDPVPDLWVGGLESDSRKVQPGDLFIALQGQQVHGLAYFDDVLSAGAIGVLYEPEGAPLAALEGRLQSCFVLPVPGLSKALGPLASRFYGDPSSRLCALAVTGTNGKTSCTHYLAEALGVGSGAAVIGTLGWGVPGQLCPTRHTTPDPIELQSVLSHLVDSGCSWVAMEASSHGLAQSRLSGVRFKGALFTNFTRDHLDYHGTMEAYLESKMSLVDWPSLAFVVFHAEHAFAGPIHSRAAPSVRRLAYCREGFSVAQEVAVLRYGRVRTRVGGLSFDVHYEGKTHEVSVPLFGDFNVDNVVGVLGVLICLGFDLASAVARLSEVRGVPGRMEAIPCGERQVIVDYAHTPDALASVLAALRQHVEGALWVVFGCGGNRDRGKRPEMGAIAARLADEVVVTDDNPRDEDGDAIVAEILAGMDATKARIIRNRRAAIVHALSAMKPTDLLVVAGKGHETTQEMAGVRYPFQDRQVIEESCGQLFGSTVRPKALAGSTDFIRGSSCF